MKRYVDIERIGKQFGTCLWVASYKTTGLQLAPDFAYFPSMNYVAMWQFADNMVLMETWNLFLLLKEMLKTQWRLSRLLLFLGVTILFGLEIRGGQSQIVLAWTCISWHSLMVCRSATLFIRVKKLKLRARSKTVQNQLKIPILALMLLSLAIRGGAG